MRWALLLLAATPVLPARANSATDAGDGLTGFVTYGNGELRGRVTDDAHPVAGATVHVVCKGVAEVTMTTDRNGKYRADLACGHEANAFVFVRGTYRIEGLVTTEVDNVIESHEAIPPRSMPKATTPVDRVLDYSDSAMDADKWTRAWLLLDVDERGRVDRIKLLNAPGFDLDALAIKAGFEVEFEPARDAAGNAVKAAVLWTFEWPAYWFMRKTAGTMYRLPEIATEVGCTPTRANAGYYRDCTPPDLAHLADRAWIDRP